MSFSVDHSQASAGLLPEGEYECIIEFARQTTTRMGTPFIDIPLLIRKDVPDNPRHGGKIFHSLWMKREPTQADLACDGYSAKQIQSLSKAAGLPNGNAYADIDEWCADLAGRTVRVTVAHNTYKGNTNARVKWVNETRHPTVVAADEETTAALAGRDGFTPLPKGDNDDVPF